MTQKNVRTAAFRDRFDRLPAAIQRLAVLAFRTFCQDPNHPALRRHQLKDNDKGRQRRHSFSVSITMKYRGIYVVDGDTNVWYWIGSHSDYDAYTGV